MKAYQFTKNITVQGVPRTCGELVPASEMPEGTIAPLLRNQAVMELDVRDSAESDTEAAPKRRK